MLQSLPPIEDVQPHVPAIEVGKRELARTTAESPVVETSGLGPCIGIAVHDPTTRTGYMTYLVMPMGEQPTITALMQSAISGAADPRQLRVWVRGGRAPKDNDRGQRDWQLMQRDIVANSLQQFGLQPTQIDSRWDDADVETTSTHMRLDARTGEFSSETPDPEALKASGGTALRAALQSEAA